MTETSLIGSIGNINAQDAVVLDESAPLRDDNALGDGSSVSHMSANMSYASSSSSSAASSYGIHAASVGETPEEYRRYQRVHLNNVENVPFFYGLVCEEARLEADSLSVCLFVWGFFFLLFV
jgi:hypothetical protein